jgi:dTDP-4-amino-4,6-dideoxygalactose transaminase
MILINDLSRSVQANSEQLIIKIQEIIKSGRYILGEQNSIFEEEFSKYLGIKYVHGVANGTDALEIALRAVGCKKGSKVVLAANAGAYGAIAANAIGCELIYSDVNIIDGNISLENLAGLLTSEVSAVIVTHLYGNIAKVDEIATFCNSLNIPLIEDCAQAAGGSINGKKAGTFGSISTFSFYPTKNLGGTGDGGALCTDDISLSDNIKKLSQYGWGKKYNIETFGGMNSRLDEIQAASILEGLKSLDKRNSVRRNIIAKFSDTLVGKASKVLTGHSNGSACHLAIVVLPDGADRKTIRKKIEDNGIQTDLHYPMLDIEQIGLGIQNPFMFNLVNSNILTKRIFTIPCFPELTSAEIELICKTLGENLD